MRFGFGLVVSTMLIGTPLFAHQPCAQTISFAIARGDRVEPVVLAFTEKWISKNQKKYAGLCFGQTPNPEAKNYLLVFSTSEAAFQGVYPTLRTTTSVTSTPVSGSGTVTNNYGSTWNYSFDGTMTTTTTTATQVDLPYTDTAHNIFLHVYDQNGLLVSDRWRTVTTRQGGDGANTFGYNLGAMLSAIHIKERLLKDGVQDVYMRPDRSR